MLKLPYLGPSQTTDASMRMTMASANQNPQHEVEVIFPEYNFNTQPPVDSPYQGEGAVKSITVEDNNSCKSVLDSCLLFDPD